MSEKIKELKKELAELDRLTAIADITDREYDQNPENEEIEAKFDRAYEKEWYQMEKCIKILSELLNIDIHTARKMIHTKRSEINALLARTA